MRMPGIARASLFCVAVLTSLALVVTRDATAGAARQKPPRRSVAREVRAACDAAYTIVRKTPGISIRRRSGTFRDETLQKPVVGCGLMIRGSYARARGSGDATSRLRQGFHERGWQEMRAYSADGTDGTSFAFRKVDVVCLARGTWDGGAVDLPPGDWYRLTVFCTSPPFPDERYGNQRAPR